MSRSFYAVPEVVSTVFVRNWAQVEWAFIVVSDKVDQNAVGVILFSQIKWVMVQFIFIVVFSEVGHVT